MKAELRSLQARFEEAIAGHEREVKGLHEQARDLTKQRESALREVSEWATWGGQIGVPGVASCRARKGC